MRNNESQRTKEQIFQRLAQVQNVESNAEVINQQAEKLLERHDLHAPLMVDDVADAFVQKIVLGKLVGTTGSMIDSMEKLPTAVLEFLRHHGLPEQVYVQKTDSFKDINWKNIVNLGADIDGQQDGYVAVSMADCGVAETGSVIFHSGENNPVLINFLGLYQVIVIEKSNIIKTMDDYALSVDSANPPRNTIWITGASGTTDIEGVLVQGAHGPCQLHIVVVG